MKSFTGLYEDMLTDESLEQAILDAAIGKHSRRCVQRALNDTQGTIKSVRRSIIDGTWTDNNIQPKVINESNCKKTRVIYRPSWYPEQIVHHAIVNQMKKYMTPRMYPGAYGVVSTGRVYMDGITAKKRSSGSHAAAQDMTKFIRKCGNKRLYVAELDIAQFYGSINHDILINTASRLFRDKQFIDVIKAYIEPYEGVPLGNALSPWLATLYIMDMDEYILQSLKPAKYVRYVDNLWIVSTNKRRLHRGVTALTRWMQCNKRLRFGRTRQVYRFEEAIPHVKSGRAIDVVGFIIHRDRVGVRKSILRRARRKALRLKKKGKVTWYDASQMLSRLAYIRHGNVYGYYRRHIMMHVSVRRCKLLVSIRHRRVQAQVAA